MKVGVAFYYKNIEQYNPEWVKKCFDSIGDQTFQNFEVYILNFGEHEVASNEYEVPQSFATIAHIRHKPLPNYADAMNYIYSWIFEECDVVVNTNIDDYYDIRRLEILLPELEKGADIVSSNFHSVDEKNKLTWSSHHAKMDIYKQLCKGYNPVSNPCHIMKKRVFEQLKFDSTLVPAEDMDYWKKAIEAGFKIVVRPEYLHYYRMHKNQSTNKLK